MLDAKLDRFDKARLDITHLNRESSALGDRLAATLTNYTKIALVSYSKIATGGTLKSIRWRTVSDRPSAMFGVAASGVNRRQVIADKSYFFIMSGRRAGAKMPIRLVGTGPRGGKIFEPLPALVKWFTALAIPRAAWFPILRAIKRRGIKPTPVSQRAIRMAGQAIRNDALLAGQRIAKGLVKVNAR